MTSLLFENKHLIITYKDQGQYLLLTWNGFIPSAVFRALADEIIKAVKKVKVSKILSDNTEWKIISPNDYSWAAAHWFPKAELSGVTHLATVLSKDAFNRLAERTVQQMTDVSNMQIRSFEKINDAETWLALGLMPKKSALITN
jgi:hypothetical protein